MRKLYAPLIARNVPYLETNNETAELVKYAANGMLALRISFVNELALLCDLTGGDIAQVSKGIGLDPRTVSVQDPDSLSGKILRLDPITGRGLADNPFAQGPDLPRWYGCRPPLTASQCAKIVVIEATQAERTAR